MKRLLILALVLCLVLAAVAVPAGAEEEPVKITWFQVLDSKASASMQSYDESPTWQYIQDKLNIDIEWIQPTSSQLSEQFSLMAAKQMYDVVYYTWTNVPGGPAQYIDGGKILDLTDIIEEMAPNYYAFISDEANAEMVKQTTLNDGRVYIFAKVFPDARSMSYNGFIMRKDWLDKLNLDLPDNIADWEAALTAIKTGDLNGNGENDEIPFVPEGIGHIRQFATAWGVRSGLYPDLETGEITFGQLHEEYKDFLMKMHEWYEAGLIDPEFASVNTANRQQKMTTDVGGSFYGAVSGGIGTILNLMAAERPDYDLTGVAYPAMEDGRRYTANDPLCRRFVGQGAAVSATTEHLEEVMKLLDFCYSEEGNVLLNWGIEGESYVVNEDGSRSFTDYVNHNPDGLAMAQAVIHYAYPSSDAPVVNDYNARKLINYALPQQDAASKLWADCDYSMLLPVLMPTAEDSSRMAELLNEINTYIDEMETKFVMGRESFDNYDTFVKTIYDMGVEELIEIEQRTYDAYLAK